MKKKILLHICCAGCGAYVAELLRKEGNEVLLFFCNPSLWPESEFEIRAKEVEKIAKELDLEKIIVDQDHETWLEKVRGLEKEKEKGQRCLICYEDRLRATAQAAKENSCEAFTSTLTVSPHKLAKEIIKIGEALEGEFGVEFLARDFKKQAGFQKASALSRELGLYRQTYCGCEFSGPT